MMDKATVGRLGTAERPVAGHGFVSYSNGD